MGYKEHKKEASQSASFAVLVVSDSRTKETDKSGKLIIEYLENSGHCVPVYKIIKNDATELISELESLLQSKGLDVIITSGGTGISSRDITATTVTPLLQKKLDGFGELFRSLTYEEIGTPSIMSRALGGVAGGKIIFCLPGSTGAAKLAMAKIILPEIGHLLWEARR